MRNIALGTAHITQKGIEYVHDVLTSGRITYGTYSQRFEQLFARMHDSRFAVLSNSGTSSLQVALHGLKILKGWKDGDEILVPSTTFVASVNVILQNGLVPHFVDVDPHHYDLQAKLIASAITKRTRGIMVVHVFGQPADMSHLLPLAKKYKLSIIEDSCETMFAKHNGKPVGSWGDVACFSMYTAHLITTGVGGVAITNNQKLALLMKSLCNHGRDSLYLSIDDDEDTKATSFAFILKNRFKFRHIGYSYRVTELEAALGLAQLETYTDIIVPRQRNAAYLTKGLSDVRSFFQLPSQREGSEHVYMVYPLVICDKRV
ncbi:MAG: DegT/DnrJ/EryC1/StrS family aminotransferase, partial [Candidatus Roizmanbacteria bacterium]|nr:DegT/DnrJ/EryC1/StrS family aminotransferase [Candidatus Roizmanbacteria bacterium]